MITKNQMLIFHNVNIASFNNSNVPIPHREGLEERMKNPHLYKHGNPFQYKEKVKKYYPS